jgi:hypothetical protein
LCDLTFREHHRSYSFHLNIHSREFCNGTFSLCYDAIMDSGFWGVGGCFIPQDSIMAKSLEVGKG